MDAWIGHLITVVAMGAGLAGVYAGMRAQIAVLTIQVANLQTKIAEIQAGQADGVELAHRRYCETSCPVRRAYDRDEWRETTGVRGMPTDPHGHPHLGEGG